MLLDAIHSISLPQLRDIHSNTGAALIVQLNHPAACAYLICEARLLAPGGICGKRQRQPQLAKWPVPRHDAFRRLNIMT